MPKTTALTHKPECDRCGEPAVVTKRIDGRTVHLCFDCLNVPPSKKEKNEKLLKQLGLIA